MTKVAFQGEPGAYSEAAGRWLYGRTAKLVPCEDFPTVFESVQKGLVDFGIVPIENSLAGSIHQNYDLLLQTKLYTVKEIFLRIEHALLCHPKSDVKKLRDVLSHPQALSQCSGYLKKKAKLKPVAFYDTAGAAKHIAELGPSDQAAIASAYAGKLYGLHIMQRNIENNNTNTTRFLAISRKAEHHIQKRGTYKTSLSFTPNINEAGILFRLLGVFALRNINLLKIESRPLPHRQFEYCFYLDIDGHPSDKKVSAAIDQLREMAAEVVVFGSYPVGAQKRLP